MKNNQDVIAESIGLKRISLDDLKIKFNLPKEAEFRGYLVHVEKADEFLGYLKDTPLSTQRGFVKSPEQALIFDKFGDAFKATRPSKDEIVVGMFDLGKQIMIYPI